MTSSQTEGLTEATRFGQADDVTLQTCASGILGRIDRYALLQELGGGGFGVVYLARDTVAGVDVAVKGLPPLVRNNAEELEHIRRNFALVSVLYHPNIAPALVLHQAHDVSYSQEHVRQSLRVLSGDFLMVMAYAPGMTLNKWRRQFPDGKVPVERAVECCRQIASALDYAHGEKIIHRDVKPSNVVAELLPDGGLRCRVLDFGLAAEIHSSLSRISNENFNTSGTRPYMAPEQWQGMKQGPQTDQYALAVVFHELVSGAVPFAPAFQTGDALIMINVVTHEKPEPLPQLSRSQNKALLRGLSKEASKRFATCMDFVAALEEGGNAESVRTRNKTGVVVAAGLLAGVTGLSYLAFVSSERRHDETNARRSRLEAATNEAEIAYAAGGWGVATARLDLVRSAGAEGAALASEMSERWETDVRGKEAAQVRDHVMSLDRGQGFGVKLDGLQEEANRAEVARMAGRRRQAIAGYKSVLKIGGEILALENARKEALAAQAAAQEAKDKAVLARAATYATEDWRVAEQAEAEAKKCFEKGSFEELKKAWPDVALRWNAARLKAEQAAEAAQKAEVLRTNQLALAEAEADRQSKEKAAAEMRRLAKALEDEQAAREKDKAAATLAAQKIRDDERRARAEEDAKKNAVAAALPKPVVGGGSVPVIKPVAEAPEDPHLYFLKGSLNAQPQLDPARFTSAGKRFKTVGSDKVADALLGKTWILYQPNQIMTYDNALSRASSLGGRLPTMQEISSLLVLQKRETKKDWARINGDFFPEHSRTTQFWAEENNLAGKITSSLMTLRALHCVVDFSDGTASNKSQDDQYGVLVIKDE